MKNYDELTDRLLQRRDRYIAEQKRKRKKMVRVASSAGCCVLIGAIGVSLMHSGVFTETPPMTSVTTTVTNTPTEIGDTTKTNNATATTTDGGIVTPTTPTTSILAPSQSTTPSKTQPPATTPSKTEPTKTNPTQPTASLTKPTATQTKSTQTTVTTQPTTTDSSDGDIVEPLPEWPCLWIYYENRKNYGNEEIPIYFKLEGFEEVDPNWVKETSYTAEGFSIVGDITVERDAETGGLIYRMVLAYDGVTPKPSFFFNVVSIDGIEQTAGLYGYLADHGFFVSVSYDAAVSYSYYYLVETGVLTHDEYRKIMEKYWSGSIGWS